MKRYLPDIRRPQWQYFSPGEGAPQTMPPDAPGAQFDADDPRYAAEGGKPLGPTYPTPRPQPVYDPLESRLAGWHAPDTVIAPPEGTLRPGTGSAERIEPLQPPVHPTLPIQRKPIPSVQPREEQKYEVSADLPSDTEDQSIGARPHLYAANV